MKTKMITQKEYDKFYEDVMEFVRNEDKKPKLEKVLPCCIAPDFFEETEISYRYNLLHQNEISLCEREFGQFIDDEYKSRIIKVLIYGRNNGIEELKYEISVSIRKHFGIE